MEKYYRQIEGIHVNTQPPRAYFVPFGNLATGERRREFSPYLHSLNGKWDFAYIPNTDAFLPSDDSCPRFTFTHKIPVPSNWQLFPELVGDTPQYINQDYPFPVDPPHLPDVIPSGYYHRTFNIAKKDKRYFINFEGVASCFYLWVNGVFQGFGSVSHCTNEFEVTEAIRDGENEINVLVVKYCVGSYCEDQDFFRLNGIFRDVYVLERENNFIRDIYCRQKVSEDLKSAVIQVEIDSVGDVAVNYTLSDKDFKRLETGSEKGSFTIEIKDVELWNPEQPCVYNLCVQAGNEFIDLPLALRRFEIKGRTVYLNGVKIKAKGINRHDTHPEKGYAVNYEDMLKDLYILKSANVNMIRTSHYPNDPVFLEMCDRIGFMVVDEADLETHGMGYNFGDWYWDFWAHICDDEKYRELCVDRAARLFERDKNHGCVCLWSLGNESGCGENHRAMAQYIRSRNSDNLIHYENAHLEYSERVGKDFTDISDVESRMYASVEYLRDYLNDENQTKPFFYCEYVCSMSTGDVYKHWDDFEDNDGYFGGCIWEFADHAVNIGDKLAPVYRYGGDWGEYPNDNYCCVDGLVYPDRSPRPGFYDMKKVYEPYFAEYSDGVLRIRNKKYFTDSKDIYIDWCVETDGKAVRKGTIDSPDIAPGETKSYGLFDACAFEGNTVLNVIFRERNRKPWCEKGFEIGFGQFILSEEKIELSDKNGDEKPAVLRDGGLVSVYAADSKFTFDSIQGKLISVVRNNTELLKKPCEWNLMRATTYNTRGVMGEWKRARYDKISQKTYSFDVAEKENEVIVTIEIALSSPAMPPAIKGTATYKIGSDGKIMVSFQGDVTSNATPLPEFSFIMQMSSEFENIRYYGYGPSESYKERHRAMRLGYYKSTVTDNLEKYIKPQECGAHYGTKLAVLSGMSNTLAVTAGKPSGFSFNALHYTWDMLEYTAHYDELKPMKSTVMKICYDMDNHVYRFDEKHIDFEFDMLFR